MLKLIPVLLILIIVVITVSCKPTKDTTEPADVTTEDPKEVKPNNPDELIGVTWNVAYIQELDARTSSKKTVSITFNDGGGAQIKLSVNSCVATYKANETSIKIVEEGCTEMCCDDDFDKQLLSLIRGNEFSYELNGDKLVLIATNAKIVLSKK